MRFLIFSPVVRTSAIGRMAALVVRQLSEQGHEVSVVRTETSGHFGADAHDFGVIPIDWGQQSEITARAKECDAVVYQIGDNFDFHRGCLEWLPVLPGVVCLHDYFLGHLFWGWADLHGRERAQRVLSTWYGSDIAMDFFNTPSSTKFIESSRIAAPMTEWISAMASGVITHSGWDIARVLKSCSGPVEIVPLPYDKPSNFTTYAQPIEANPVDGTALNVLTIGHVNANKRAESVICAIGSSAFLRARLCYRIVGKIEPLMATHLHQLARDKNVSIVITGEVDQATLAKEIFSADVMCCLRLPVLEAASASTIEAMLMGKATLVMNDGFYRELPDSCVFKISPESEEEDIRETLTKLATQPSLRVEIGNNAAIYAEKTFSAKRYAIRLAEICTSVAIMSPAVKATFYFASLIESWGGTRDEEIIKQIISPLHGFVDVAR